MIQQVINFLYRYPKSGIKKIKRYGGLTAYLQMLYERSQMKRNALLLSPVTSHSDGLPVYFLTGRDYLYQTLFCIRSLVNVSAAKFRFILIDDGSFDAGLIRIVHSRLPGALVMDRASIEKNLEKYLPLARYPILHEKRKVYPHIKKLTDIHTIPGSNWKLVLDSDMLFWREPTAVINWLQQPVCPLHMVDCVESYGYSHTLMEEVSRTKIPVLLNVGAIGLSSEAIDWGKLNDWVKLLEEKEGSSYYLEQAITAMLIGDAPSTVLEPAAYIVNPAHLPAGVATDILHHYVDLSKKIYFNQAWKMIS